MLDPLNPWFGRAVRLLGLTATIAIRAPHDTVSKQTKIAQDRRGRLEVALMMLGRLVLPLVSFSPLLAFADDPLTLLPLVAGSVVTGRSCSRTRSPARRVSSPSRSCSPCASDPRSA